MSVKSSDLSDRIHATIFPQGEVRWRSLPWGRFRFYRDLFASNTNTPEIEDKLYRECFVESTLPEGLDLAGTISTTVKSILAFSGAAFTDTLYNQLAQARGVISTVEEQLIALVFTAFPYKPEDLEQLPWDTVLKRAAQAEIALGVPLNPADAPQKTKTIRGRQR